MTTNYYSGHVHVNVMMFVDYETDGVTIPASEERPCKLSLPLQIAERYVDNGLAEFCDVGDEVGAKGEPGAPGCDGTDGTDATPGGQGTAGTDGLDGAAGTPGMDGVRGRTGLHNNTAGPPGEPGCPGQDGEPGAPGQDGVPGTPGANGGTGEPGVMGAKGAPSPPGGPGAPGSTGGTGTMGDMGGPGADGLDGYVCPQGMFEKIEITTGIYRIITRDKDCNVLDDFIWDTNPPVEAGTWCTESEVTIDWDADDYKTRDDPNGITYEVPNGQGGTCTIDMNFGIPSDQPCRSTACGYVPGNNYEDLFPNVNAYGTAWPEHGCKDIPMEVLFGCAICGDIAIRYFDVDETSGGPGGDNCNEQIKNVSPAPSGLNGQLVEISPGVYTGQGSGNTDSEGELLWTNLTATDRITFDVRLIGGRSMGFGFAGTQTFKFVDTGTYEGDTFFDADGNEIDEPTGWVDC